MDLKEMGEEGRARKVAYEMCKLIDAQETYDHSTAAVQQANKAQEEASVVRKDRACRVREMLIAAGFAGEFDVLINERRWRVHIDDRGSLRPVTISPASKPVTAEQIGNLMVYHEGTEEAAP